MSPDEIQFPVAYYDGVAYCFTPSGRYSPTYFGGPSDYKAVGKAVGSRSLHHVMTFAGAITPALDRNFVFTLPLFYGMQHDGCRLVYRMPENYRFEITSMEPANASPEWPYPNYPTLFPYIPLELKTKEKCTVKRFLEWTHQGLEIKPNTMVVLVPPVFVGGVSMWGPGGDAEGVQIVFECDFEKKTVRATNQCS